MGQHGRIQISDNKYVMEYINIYREIMKNRGSITPQGKESPRSPMSISQQGTSYISPTSTPNPPLPPSPPQFILPKPPKAPNIYISKNIKKKGTHGGPQQRPKVNKDNIRIQENNGNYKYIPSGEKMCADYSLGLCKLGDICPLMHRNLPRTYRPSSIPDLAFNRIFGVDLWQNVIADISNTVGLSKQSTGIQGLSTIAQANGKIRFFVIKSKNYENIDISMKYNVWSTTKPNQRILTDAYLTSDHVFLIFSKNISHCFQGFARMESQIDPTYLPNIFHENRFYERSFHVKWIAKTPIEFWGISDLMNTINNLPLKYSRDGQEINLESGYEVCLRIEHQEKLLLLDMKSEQKERNSPQPGNMGIYMEGKGENYQENEIAVEALDVYGGREKQIEGNGMDIDSIVKRFIKQFQFTNY